MISPARFIQLSLPYPPSVNHYWGQGKHGRFIGKRGVAFRQAVAEAALEAEVQPLLGRLSVHIALFPPDKRQRDVDNVLKSLLDACEHAGCYESDSQIDELHIVRQEIQKGGSCTIVILGLGSHE
jgi:crossover junction endodeoxyribonuclease RusA